MSVSAFPTSRIAARRQLPVPPRHLSKATKSWFRQVVADYELTPSDLKLLIAAAELLDRAENARIVIDDQGATFIDRFGSPRSRPEVAIERDSKIGFSRILKQLKLDDSGNGPVDPRPPHLKKSR